MVGPLPPLPEFTPAGRDARIARRAKARKARERRGCVRLVNRGRWPRYRRQFAKRVYPRGHRARGFGRRQYVPARPLNACNTQWPGGYINVRSGASLPGGFVRTGFQDGQATNPRCFPSSGGFGVSEAQSGTLGGAVALARTEAQRLTTQARVEALRNAPRDPTGTTVADQNAFALRYSDDLCRPVMCAFDGPSWSESQNRAVVRDRADMERRAAHGFRLVPLDVAGVRSRLGHDPTPGDLVAACASGQDAIQSKRFKTRTGAWASALARKPGDVAAYMAKTRASRIAGAREPLPGLPGQVVTAFVPTDPLGNPLPPGTALSSRFGQVMAGTPTGNALQQSREAYTILYPDGHTVSVAAR